MKRAIIACLALASAKAGVAQSRPPDLTQPVSYRTVAIPLHQALGDLGRVIGANLTADGDLNEERIILRLVSVPAQTVLDKIAQTCDAEWKAVDGGYELTRPPALLAKLQRADLDRRISRIKESIDRMASDAKADGRMTKDKADQMAEFFVRTQDLLDTGVRAPATREERAGASRRMAETRFLAELLAQMDPAEIASLTPGGRFVYTVKPNSVQRQLPAIDEATLKEYVGDQNLISDAVVDRVTKAKGQQYAQSLIDSYPHLADQNLLTFVILQPWVGSDLVQADLEVLDGTHRTVGTASALLGNSMSAAQYSESLNQAKRDVNDRGLDVDPVLKPLLAISVNGGSSTASPPTIDPGLRDALLNPTAHDPLSFFTSECVLRIADSENADTVFVPSDEMESAAMSACRSGKFNRRVFELIVTKNSDMQFSDDGGWYLGKPTSALRADALRCPRQDLEQYLHSIDAKGYASIEDRVSMVQATAYGVADVLPGLVRNDLWGPVQGNYPMEQTLRLYGSLSEEQKQAAKTRLTLTYAELTDAQRKMLDWFVYTGFQGFSFSEQASKTAKPSDWNALTAERTEITPNGLSAGDTLTISESNEPVIFYSLSYHGQPSFQMTSSLDESAQRIAACEIPGPDSTRSAIDNMRAGTRRQIILTATIGGEYEMGGGLYEPHGDEASGVAPDKFAGTLSPDLRNKFLAALARYRSQFKNVTRLGSDSPQPATPPAG